MIKWGEFGRKLTIFYHSYKITNPQSTANKLLLNWSASNGKEALTVRKKCNLLHVLLDFGEWQVAILKGIPVNHAINCMISSRDCQFLSHDFLIHMSVFSRPDLTFSASSWHWDILLMPNKGDVLYRITVPKVAWSSDLIGLFRIAIHVLSCHIKNTAPPASLKIFFSIARLVCFPSVATTTNLGMIHSLLVQVNML